MDCDISARRQNEEVRCGTTAGGSSHTEAFIDLRSYPRDGEGNQVTDTSWGTREFGFRDLDGFDSGETFSGVDYGTALKSVEDIRKLVPTRISMAQFALRWILTFDAISYVIPGGTPLSQAAMDAVNSIYNNRIRPLLHSRW
jgi:hypothetical protein